jgi:hypothetical protein
MGDVLHSHHRTELMVSQAETAPGGSATLRWRVIGVDADVASVHLTSSVEDGPRMIECVPSQGARELIFSEPGRFIFRLTATFGDGAKQVRVVSIIVQR